MKRTAKVTARFSDDEKLLLTRVAIRLQRTNSDTLRLLVLAKAEELGLPNQLYRKESDEEHKSKDYP